MPRPLPRVVLGGRAAEARRASRKGIWLRDFTITVQTRRRYESAVGTVLPCLEARPDPSQYDIVISEWIELQWARGESFSTIADALSGLQFFWPELKGTLRMSWHLFRNWRRVESPAHLWFV